MRRGSIRSATAQLVAVGLVVFGAAACGNDLASTLNAPQSDVLQFTATLAGGGDFDGNSLAGRPAVLWFWAPT